MTVKETADRATAYASDKLASASDKLQDATGQLRETASDTFAATKDKVAVAYDAAKEKSGVAYENARDYAAAAAETVRETAASVRVKTAGSIDDSPIGALIGGVAIGMLLGALLPRTQREAQTLGPVGDKLSALARNAIAAAKEAGQDTLDELGVNKDAARQQVDRLIETASKAASSAGTAAADTIRSASPAQS